RRRATARRKACRPCSRRVSPGVANDHRLHYARKQMSAAPVESRLSRLWAASIGKKAVMALTGVILFGFLIGHVAGNLQVFAGPEKINAYSEFLHHSPGILWGTRAVLLVALILHVTAAVQLYAQKGTARPQKYSRWRRRTSSLPSRWMLWSGFAILLFVIY